MSTVVHETRRRGKRIPVDFEPSQLLVEVLQLLRETLAFSNANVVLGERLLKHMERKMGVMSYSLSCRFDQYITSNTKLVRYTHPLHSLSISSKWSRKLRSTAIAVSISATRFCESS